MDILNDFRDIIYKYSDIPLPFIEAGAYSIISTCYGRFYRITKSRDKRPNTFIVLASAPHMTRRSDLLKHVSTVRFKAFETYRKGTNDAENEIKSHILESGSPEGLIDDINSLKNEFMECFCLSSSEFGTSILKPIINKSGYMAHMDALLCKLWSGEYVYQSFSNKGKKNKKSNTRYLEAGTYFNIFSTMQKAKQYLDEGLSKTGLARRLLIVSVEGTDLTEYKPPLGYDTDEMTKELEKLGIRIGNEMIKMDKKQKNPGYIPIPYNEDVEKIINTYSKDWEIRARDNDEDPYMLYQQSRWEHVLKIACCNASSTVKSVITKKHVESAIKFVDNSTKNMEYILNQSLIDKEKERENKLLNKMCQWFKDGLKKREVQQRLSAYNIHKTEFEGFMKILINDQRIKMKGNEGGFDVL